MNWLKTFSRWIASYWMPRSLTFWTGMFMIASGVLLLVDTEHPFPGLAGSIFRLGWGGMAPLMVAANGIGFIALRRPGYQKG